MESRVYGPVPSRRLGKSLGVNNIPHKVCSYSCLYCQIGKAGKLQIQRQEFYKPEALAEQVRSALSDIPDKTQVPDYIAIVPDGEPTLDLNLGKLISQLKVFDIPVAVISNSSRIGLPEVQEELLGADYVSLKIDAINEPVWKKINIPHSSLNHSEIFSGIKSFACKYSGILVTETMLVKGINDSTEELKSIAEFIGSLNFHGVYISVPTRPTAFSGIECPDEKSVLEAYSIFRKNIGDVELLTGYEGNSFSASGDSENDLLSITAVHPMREDAVLDLLKKNGDDKQLLTDLLKGKLKKIHYNNSDYYVRSFNRNF